MKLNAIGEFGLIARMAKLLPKVPKGIVGIGDDTAVLPYSKNEYLLLTTDMMAENVHFTRRMDLTQVGHKALACNISDIAAMGGTPTYGVISLGLPGNVTVAHIEKIYHGISQTAKAHGVHIVGGDTIKNDKLVINIALLGIVPKKHLLTRGGAKPKDWIFVTGPLGRSFKSGGHLTFNPRVDEARFLVKNFMPSAMIDVSDGLAGDLNHILEQSRVGARLWPEAVPLNKGAQFQDALVDGEDYELLFTMNPRTAHKLMRWQFKKKVFHFYPIGEITADKKQRIHGQSFAHF